MKIILKKLSLRNFKGIVDREITFDGNTNIYGANESGKSTIYTAFNWLLTGKDEFDRQDYEIKNTVRKELNSQSHEVEAILITEDSGIEIEHKIKRVYLEKWVKQRGQSQKTFEGHKTEFWWNDVPCNKSEFEAKVSTIIDSKILKLITNPNFFTSLKWDEQRRGLIAIAGTITNQDIINRMIMVFPNNDYSSLLSVLNNGKTVDEYKKELASKKSLLKKKAVEYAPRIDEARRNIPEALNWSSIQQKLNAKQQEIQAIEDQLSNTSKALSEKQKAILEKQNTLHNKETELSNLKQSIRTEVQSKFNTSKAEIASIEQQIKLIRENVTRLQKNDTDNTNNKISYQNRIEELNSRVAQLRKDWDAINSEVFEFDESTCTCPTCKQQLPAYDIETKKVQLRKNFNDDVAKRKDDKVFQSNLLKAEVQQLQDKINDIDVSSMGVLIQGENQKLVALQNKLLELQAAVSTDVDIEKEVKTSIAANHRLSELDEEISGLTEEIEAKSSQLGNTDNTELKSRKLHLTIELDDIKKQLALKEVIESGENRITQLETEERENAQEISNIEQQEFDIENYTKAHMAILDERVNNMFQYVKWRLFETQVNGAVVETCVCEYNSVPYPTVNTAGKLLSGIDILNTLSKHYNIYAPVFNDNAESSTYVPPTKSQLIRLFVSPSDETLRVESANLKQLEVA